MKKRTKVGLGLAATIIAIIGSVLIYKKLKEFDDEFDTMIEGDDFDIYKEKKKL
jgi:hypothetical protein